MKVKILVSVDLPDDFPQKVSCRKCPFVKINRNAIGYDCVTEIGCKLLSCPFQSEDENKK